MSHAAFLLQALTQCWKPYILLYELQTCIILNCLLQMSTAKRTLTLPRRRSVAPLSDVALKGRISRWRGVRGIANCPCPLLGSEHKGCRQKGPYAALHGGLFMCEHCGWAHLCGEACTERFLDSQAELLVCPVSGRCFDVIVEDNFDVSFSELPNLALSTVNPHGMTAVIWCQFLKIY